MSSLPVLSAGKVFEDDVLGYTEYVYGDEVYQPPPRKDFNESIQEVVQTPLTREVHGEVELYDPTNPTWGKLPELYRAINQYLPKRANGVKTSPLCLYISVGKSLDFYHGIDCFLWWMGDFVSIDLSLSQKYKKVQGKGKLKADFRLGPEHFMTQNHLDEFGYNVAEMLKLRKYISRRKGEKGRFRQKSRSNDNYMLDFGE